jgi:hypothetical protein
MRRLAWHVIGLYALYCKKAAHSPATPLKGAGKRKVSQLRSDQLEIKFMTWGSIRITLDELIIALRHRLVVITYFVCWAGIYPIRFRPDVPYLDVWREILIFLLSQVVVIGLLPVTAGLIVLINRHKPVPALFIGFFVFVATIFGCLAIVFCFWAFTGVLSIDVGTILIYGLLHFVLTEIVGALVMTLFLPTILTDIRYEPNSGTAAKRLEAADAALMEKAEIGVVTEADLAAPSQEATPNPSAPELPPVTPKLAEVFVGGKMLPRHQLRVIRAAGNYLDITLRSDKLFVQATMRSVLQQMDSADGLLLHRSLWMAASEVESFQRQGMDILVHTRDGEAVKTARSRQSEVLAWLKQQSIPRRPAAG